MKTQKGVKEIKEVNESERNIAAFLDLDGTLMPLPSLERRFFRILRYRKEIPIRNYFLWSREGMRLLPRGINAILQANKTYLRGVHILDECGERDRHVSSWHKGGHQADGQASAPPGCNPRLPVPAFFTQAVERVAWHAKKRHEMVLIRDTLELKVREAARSRVAGAKDKETSAMSMQGATRLEEGHAKRTGPIPG